MYVNSKLCAAEFVIDSTYPEQVWCQIQDSKRNKFFIGVIYRTPNDTIFDTDTHLAVRELMSEFGTSNRHFMLMGDLNYPFIQWPPQLDTDAVSGHGKEFCNCLEDNFLSQHITIPTRNQNILDLVITDEPYMITDVTNLGALATCDHSALQWKVHVKTVTTSITRQIFDYPRADICKIKSELAKLDWHKLFTNISVEDCWTLLKNTLHQLETSYVPIKKVNYSEGKPIWLTYKALKAVKHRHQIYRKYKNSAHPACKDANLRASRAVRESRRTFEQKLSSKIKDDRKTFFAYARCKAKTKVKVESLVGPDGAEVNDMSQIAEVFNDQFSSVFTSENTTEMPVPLSSLKTKS